MTTAIPYASARIEIHRLDETIPSIYFVANFATEQDVRDFIARNQLIRDEMSTAHSAKATEELRYGDQS